MGAKPKLNDVYIITLSLVAESLFPIYRDENPLFSKLRSEYREEFPLLIDRSQFNRRRKHLHNIIDIVRQYLVSNLLPAENTFILDSLPIEICKFVRAKRVKSIKRILRQRPHMDIVLLRMHTTLGINFMVSIVLEGLPLTLITSKLTMPIFSISKISNPIMLTA